MGGLAGTAGGGRLKEPRWLEGGGATLTIASDAPTIWWLSLDDPATAARVDAVAPLPGEAATFARHHDAGERAARRRLARLLLATAGSCSVEAVSVVRDDRGAPAVVDPPGWHLSVAARWPATIIAVAPTPLGVDLERVTGELPPADVLTPAEIRWLSSLDGADRAARFAACWATKEAHAKWTGQPRSIDPATIETAEYGIARSRFGSTRCWQRRCGDLTAAACVAV